MAIFANTDKYLIEVLIEEFETPAYKKTFRLKREVAQAIQDKRKRDELANSTREPRVSQDVRDTS